MFSFSKPTNVLSLVAVSVILSGCLVDQKQTLVSRSSFSNKELSEDQFSLNAKESLNRSIADCASGIPTSRNIALEEWAEQKSFTFQYVAGTGYYFSHPSEAVQCTENAAINSECKTKDATEPGEYETTITAGKAKRKLTLKVSGRFTFAPPTEEVAGAQVVNGILFVSDVSKGLSPKILNSIAHGGVGTFGAVRKEEKAGKNILYTVYDSHCNQGSLLMTLDEAPTIEGGLQQNWPVGVDLEVKVNSASGSPVRLILNPDTVNQSEVPCRGTASPFTCTLYASQQADKVTVVAETLALEKRSAVSTFSKQGGGGGLPMAARARCGGRIWTDGELLGRINGNDPMYTVIHQNRIYVRTDKDQPAHSNPYFLAQLRNASDPLLEYMHDIKDEAVKESRMQIIEKCLNGLDASFSSAVTEATPTSLKCNGKLLKDKTEIGFYQEANGTAKTRLYVSFVQGYLFIHIWRDEGTGGGPKWDNRSRDGNGLAPAVFEKKEKSQLFIDLNKDDLSCFWPDLPKSPEEIL
jgi:hypothetical protein